jgi:DNA-binding transcriptional regulator YiaG
MANHIFNELGFPILLIDPPMMEFRGEVFPAPNMRDLQLAVFRMLVHKPTRLTGDELKFIRGHQRLRQADFAKVLHMANHSVVAQWEGKNERPTGMAYNTEVVLRIWMAGRIGEGDQVMSLLDGELRELKPGPGEPLVVELPRVA